MRKGGGNIPNDSQNGAPQMHENAFCGTPLKAIYVLYLYTVQFPPAEAFFSRPSRRSARSLSRSRDLRASR